MIRAILGKNQFETVANLSYLSLAGKYWASYNKTASLIENSDNSYYVNPSEAKKLRRKMNPLERNMLRYLLLYDKDILKLKNNKRGAKVYIRPFFMGFGLMQLTIDQV